MAKPVPDPGAETTFTVAGFPVPLRWDVAPVAAELSGGSLRVTAGPRTDMFVNPETGAPTLGAPRALGRVDGDFMLAVRVRVAFLETFDAGCLLLFVQDRRWAKLCFERSPQGTPMVVSVVTRERSDDANGWAVDGDVVHLRVSRLSDAYAFHASADRSTWDLVRHFTLEDGGQARVGFEAQSPMGDGCTVTFDEVSFSPVRLAELRDES